MDYLWLKALHIVAVVTWIGGMLVVAVTITAASGGRAQQETAMHSAVLAAVRRWDQRVTSPAMILVWILGIALALTGSWFPQGWLLAKLVSVLLLSVLHGGLSGRLRGLSRNQQPSPPPPLRYAAAAVVVATFVIVILVVTKPI
ncbi:CopD family protein [Bradyrhizobium sp. dw_411]|uniref:CopD family protein n=1 Tax=Bradyrhizobium sp. dw_411 TaxID=2720082 RepID=UPI001BCB69BE|nr:CopD family protein [Bradyrhizobium sp. dw_411]